MDLKTAFQNVIVTAIAGYLYTHDAHNYIKGPSFFGDHAWLADACDTYVEIRDELVENAKGNGYQYLRDDLLAAAVLELKAIPTATDATVIFQGVLKIEENLRAGLDALIGADGCPVDTQNMAGGIAQASRKRTFMVGQRLG